MQTTTLDVKQSHKAGEVHYHPVLWYLPEYMEYRENNPEDPCSHGVLNNMRRIAAIKRLAIPPMLEDKRVIIDIRFEETSEDLMVIRYMTVDLDKVQAGNPGQTHEYTRTIAKGLFSRRVDEGDIPFIQRTAIV